MRRSGRAGRQIDARGGRAVVCGLERRGSCVIRSVSWSGRGIAGTVAVWRASARVLMCRARWVGNRWVMLRRVRAPRRV
jgi:hypothetical protein